MDIERHRCLLRLSNKKLEANNKGKAVLDEQ